MVDKNSSTVRHLLPIHSNMVLTPSATGRGCTGWKWRRYNCHECQEEVPYNKCVDHFVRKHYDTWRRYVGTIQAFIEKNFDEVQIIEENNKEK